MITIAITSYKEPRTIGKAIDAFVSQGLKDYEIIVSAPDEETLEVARKYAKKNKRIRIIKDKGIGKPAALNMISQKARGEIIIFSDGDVYVDEGAVAKIINKFSNPRVGAVSGRPVSVNDKGNMLGFWAYTLTEIADETRRAALEKEERFFCSGYLFGIRKKLFPRLDASLLSEDGYISFSVYENGYSIEYCPDALVYVKYPTSFRDWMKQKIRSAGGYSQIRSMTGTNMRSFGKESRGVFRVFRYVTGIREFFWIKLLILARIWLWLRIYIDINVKNKSQKEIWQRVESTK